MKWFPIISINHTQFHLKNENGSKICRARLSGILSPWVQWCQADYFWRHSIWLYQTRFHGCTFPPVPSGWGLFKCCKSKELIAYNVLPGSMKKKEEGKKIVDGGEVSRTCAGFKCGGMWQRQELMFMNSWRTPSFVSTFHTNAKAPRNTRYSDTRTCSKFLPVIQLHGNSSILLNPTQFHSRYFSLGLSAWACTTHKTCQVACAPQHEDGQMHINQL